MFKLDRSAHKTYNFKEIQKESDNYFSLSAEERFKVFAYLQSVAYNFSQNNPPKMDKTIHSYRKHG
ncbi:MAG: hypothetical protein J0L69_00415 [Bacteroidetes bacterium]|nr:hypothetical protein [Bacteroidota bacterium]